MISSPTRTLFITIAILFGGTLTAPSIVSQEAQKQELKKSDTLPPSGSAGGPSAPDQNAKQESSSKVEGTNSESPTLVDGALTAPGAPTDVDTIPSKFSTRTAADDKQSIAAYTLKHLTEAQRKAIRDAVVGSASGSGSRAFGGHDSIGAEISTAMALDDLQPLPASVLMDIPEMRGIFSIVAGERVLLVNAKSAMVVGVLE